MSPLIFSMAPFCYDEYGSAKYTFTPMLFAIIS